MYVAVSPLSILVFTSLAREMDTDLPTSVQQATETKLLQSLPLHNRTRLLTFPLSACLLPLREEPAIQHSDAPDDIVASLGVWAGFSTSIQDLAQSLPAAYRRGLVRLPQAVVKPLHQLTNQNSQKWVDLVEALVSWCLVDELLRCEGIDDGEFAIDYQAKFKPSAKLTQWVTCLAEWPSVLLSTIRSQDRHHIETALPSLPAGTQLSTEQKALWQDLQAACSWHRRGHQRYWEKLLHLIEGVAWQLRWMRRTRGDPEAYGRQLQMFAVNNGMTNASKYAPIARADLCVYRPFDLARVDGILLAIHSGKSSFKPLLVGDKTAFRRVDTSNGYGGSPHLSSPNRKSEERTSQTHSRSELSKGGCIRMTTGRLLVKAQIDKVKDEGPDETLKAQLMETIRKWFETYRTVFLLCPRKIVLSDDEVSEDVKKLVTYWREMFMEGWGGDGIGLKFVCGRTSSERLVRASFFGHDLLRMILQMYIKAQPRSSPPRLSEYLSRANVRAEVLETMLECVTGGGRAQDILDDPQLLQSLQSFLKSPDDHVFRVPVDLEGEPSLKPSMSSLREMRQSLHRNFQSQSMHPSS
ncbi:hypothetical protein IW261DRAFT_1651091 [Armillaria novae-zelandiae]|uniref:Uncharacterized protein n=1 Tax=Armillaria novae-zelandiae TaxID=153914 RepID=A0AA39NYX1_9AGAR|nr:hypothetical protein IW261DRAFT_1651091 [Armillaria novae-zelandiae]